MTPAGRLRENSTESMGAFELRDSPKRRQIALRCVVARGSRLLQRVSIARLGLRKVQCRDLRRAPLMPRAT